MSKIQDDKIEKQSGKSFPSMSSRQQILYLINKTNKETNWDPEDISAEVESMDYQKYFFDKREKKVINRLIF